MAIVTPPRINIIPDAPPPIQHKIINNDIMPIIVNLNVLNRIRGLCINLNDDDDDDDDMDDDVVMK